jgi:hypothetical protein
VSMTTTEPREPGWLLRTALAAAAEEERSRAAAIRAARLANEDRQREWLQQALERILGITVDVSDLPTDPEGRPHAIIGGEQFRAVPPAGDTGPNLILVVRCPGCWRVEREIVIPSWAVLGEALSDGLRGPVPLQPLRYALGAMRCRLSAGSRTSESSPVGWARCPRLLPAPSAARASRREAIIGAS